MLALGRRDAVAGDPGKRRAGRALRRRGIRASATRARSAADHIACRGGTPVDRRSLHHPCRSALRLCHDQYWCRIDRAAAGPDRGRSGQGSRPRALRRKALRPQQGYRQPADAGYHPRIRLVTGVSRAPAARRLRSRRRSASFAFAFARTLWRRRPDHGFKFHVVRIREIDSIIIAAVILAGRIDHVHSVLFKKLAEIVDGFSAGELEGVVMESDIAFAILVLPALRIGGGDPEQGLAVAPAGHIAVFVLQFEAEKSQQLAVKFLGTSEVADAEHEMVYTDDARHELVRSRAAGSRLALSRYHAQDSASLRVQETGF